MDGIEVCKSVRDLALEPRPIMIALTVFCRAEDGIRDWSVTGVQTCALPLLLLAAVALAGAAAHRAPGNPAAVSAKLSEWKVELSARSIAAGTVTFTVANVGSIPHAFEVEIGRASCRERWYTSVGAVSIDKKT